MPDDAMANAAAGTLWLHVEEAAARLGLHPSALRTRIARGQHPHRKDNRGRLLVPVPADAAVSVALPDDASLRHDEELARLRQRVEELTTSLHAAELALAKAEAAGAIATAKAEAERDAASAAAKAEVEAMRRELEAGVAARNAVIEELRAELVRLRRPWWRRLIGP